MRRLRVLLFLLTTAAWAAEPPLREQVTALFREQKWADAQALLEKTVTAEPTNAEAHYFLGLSFLNRNDAEHALPSLEKAVALAPTDSGYLRHLGDAYGLSAQKAGLLAKIGWAKKSKAAYDKAVELNPTDLNARWSVLEYCRQAPDFLGGGMTEAYAQAAAIKKIDAVRGRLAYVTLYVSEKKFPEAFGVYDEVLRDSPDDYAALFAVGRLAAASGENLNRGLECLNKCLTLAPPAGQPGLAPTHWQIGLILEKQGNKAAARAAYRAALSVDPKFTQAQEALAKLN